MPAALDAAITAQGPSRTTGRRAQAWPFPRAARERTSAHGRSGRLAAGDRPLWTGPVCLLSPSSRVLSL